ncbi:MAG: hypothetical protein GY749_16835 [Desulfobacteraceae bacterium]|nr:hypothetical protein [Desulfobacteraceae bacterium]
MTEQKQNNLTRSVCGGTNERFRGNPCKYYDFSSGQCLLLMEQKMDEFWKKCRCKKFEMLYEATTSYLKKFKQKYANLPVDDMEEIDFKEIISRLKNLRLKEEFNINGWRKYMNKTIYREVKGILVKKGLIPRETKCGTCKFLPGSKPYVCQKKGETRKKTGEICEQYAQKIDVFISINGSESNDDQYRDNLIFEISKSIHENVKTPETILEKEQEKNRLSIIKEILDKRIEKAKPGKMKQKYERQYDVFINLFNLLSEGIPKEESQKLLADKNGVNIRTIRRDIVEIMEFLKNNVPDA